MPIIDIHTHMVPEPWVELLRKNAAPDYRVGVRSDGVEALQEAGTLTIGFIPEMFDYDIRIRTMDEAGIDISIVSLTTPSVFWGTAEQSAEAARAVNDHMAAAQTTYPGRILFLATLPWQHADLAVAELDRACELGAVGVMTLCNIRGENLIDEKFAPIWDAIDAKGLPVLVHPTAPLGYEKMDLGPLLATVGFTFDTSLAIMRMVLDGFFDRYKKAKIIASHGGGTLPYLSGRIDLFFERQVGHAKKISQPPSIYLSESVYYDGVLYQENSIRQCVDLGGPDRVMFGTDWPHPTNIRQVLDCTDVLPKGQAAAVKGGNAVRIFGL